MATTRYFLGTLACSLCFYLAANNARAASPLNPYHNIPERNVFRLTPRPVAPAPIQPSVPLPKVRLTGITTIFGNKRALLKVQFPAGPNQAASERAYELAEGQRDGPIEVLEVNEKTDRVKMDISGTVMEVTFEKSNGKASTAASNQAPLQVRSWRPPVWAHGSWPPQVKGR